MNQRNSFLAVTLGIGFLILSIVFTNCAGSKDEVTQEVPSSVPPENHQSISPAQICLNELMIVYERTWFQLLKANCIGCHKSGHGSDNLAVSLYGFLSVDEMRIRNNATTNHHGNHFENTNNLQSINAFTADWTMGREKYEDCIPQ